MPKFVIEREMAGVGGLSTLELQHAAQTSCNATRDNKLPVQWIHSYVTGDKMYCVCVAPDEAALREHACFAGLPANRVSRVETIIDPTTAE